MQNQGNMHSSGRCTDYAVSLGVTCMSCIRSMGEPPCAKTCSDVFIPGFKGLVSNKSGTKIMHNLIVLKVKGYRF